MEPINSNNQQPQPTDLQNNVAFQTLIPTKNSYALIGYYMGVGGLIPFLGVPLSITALILGIMGLKKYSITPTPGAKAHAITAIVLGAVELATLLAFIMVIVISAIN